MFFHTSLLCEADSGDDDDENVMIKQILQMFAE